MAASDPSTEEAAAPSVDEAQVGLMVRRLAFVVFLEWLGAGAIIPLFPLYLRHQGASPTIVGITMSAFFLAGLLTQFPAGRLADRIGRRPVLIAGLLAYGLAALCFALPVGIWGFILLRFLQGAGAGAVEVASLALVASNTPLAGRGQAVSRIYSAQLAGTAVGPLLGALAGVDHMDVLFVGTAIACSIAAIPVLRSRTIRTHDVAHQHHVAPPRLRLSRSLLGAIFGALAVGLSIGVYEACWTMLLHERGASAAVIGLSWTAFCVPFVVLVRASGWMADHSDRRVLAAVGLVVSVGFLVAYPFVTVVWVLLVMGFCEAVGSAMVFPSLQSMMTEAREPRELGRVQGLFASSQTGAIALAASVAGALFGVHMFLPFVAAAAIGVALIVGLAVAWAPLEGHARPKQASSAS